jgi:peptide/nickel transport system ATP-binding protein
VTVLEASAGTKTLLEVRSLEVEYGRVRAVDGVNFQIGAGEILGVAGESGCGKSTVANAVMQILRPPARIVGGSIVFQGEDLTGKSQEELRRFRWRNVSMVFQSAMNALNPVMRVGDQFVDMMQAHERISKSRAIVRAGELLELVGMDKQRVRSYPHELSGGMRQRVAICRALIYDPDILLMDEPFSALDAITRDEMNDALLDIWQCYTKTGLFVTHSIREAVLLADRILVMDQRPSRIIEDLAVPFKRPRSNDIADGQEFGRICAHLRGLIERGHKGRAQANDVVEMRVVTGPQQ